LKCPNLTRKHKSIHNYLPDRQLPRYSKHPATVGQTRRRGRLHPCFVRAVGLSLLTAYWSLTEPVLGMGPHITNSAPRCFVPSRPRETPCGSAESSGVLLVSPSAAPVCARRESRYSAPTISAFDPDFLSGARGTSNFGACSVSCPDAWRLFHMPPRFNDNG
jgi:hypothetical protein